MTPEDRKLIEKLDMELRSRSRQIVQDELASISPQVAAPVVKALSRIISGRNQAIMASVELRIGSAIQDIARDMTEHAYKAMVDRVINQLATGQDFSLN